MKLFRPVLLVFLSYLFFPAVLFSQQPQVTGLVLVNAADGSDLGYLEDGGEINLASLPSNNLNVRAEVGSNKPYEIRFKVNGYSWYRIERSIPYAMAGDQGGQYNSWTPRVGKLEIEAIAFDSDGKPEPNPTTVTLSVIREKAKEAEPVVLREPVPNAAKQDLEKVGVTLSLIDPHFDIGSCQGSFDKTNSKMSFECSHYLKEFTDVMLVNVSSGSNFKEACKCNTRSASNGDNVNKEAYFNCSCSLPASPGNKIDKENLELVVMNKSERLASGGVS